MIFQNCWNTFEVANVRMSTFIGMLKWTKKIGELKKYSGLIQASVLNAGILGTSSHLTPHTRQTSIATSHV
jgi:hypothetical protein